MRAWSILLVVVAAAAAEAQTNTADYPTTNAAAGAAMAPATASTNVVLQVREMSLQDCLQLALEHNLDLQINRYYPQIARFALNALYGGYDPSLSVDGQHRYDKTTASYTSDGGLRLGRRADENTFNANLNGLLPWGTTYTLGGNANHTFGHIGDISTPSNRIDSSSGSASLLISQPLLKNFWIDTTRLNIRIAKNQLKSSELGLKLQIMQTITGVEQAYYDLIYNRENVVVQEKAVELAERLFLENQKRLEVGTLAPLDLQSAEAQFQSSRAALIAARSQLDTQERALKQLITDQFREWQSVSLVPAEKLTSQHQPLILQDSWIKALTQRPDFLQAKLDVENAGIQLKYDRNQLYPQLDAFGEYGYYGSGLELNDTFIGIKEGNQPFYRYGGRISIPLSFTSARNAYKSSKVSQQQVVLTLKKLEQQIMIAIDNDIGTVQSSYDAVQATRAARQYAEAALAAEQMKLDNGKSTTYTVLQVQRDLTRARGNEIQALDVYNKSLAQLSLDEGSTLERLGINLQTK